MGERLTGTTKGYGLELREGHCIQDILDSPPSIIKSFAYDSTNDTSNRVKPLLIRFLPPVLPGFFLCRHAPEALRMALLRGAAA
jgi:hypothetical protein